MIFGLLIGFMPLNLQAKQDVGIFGKKKCYHQTNDGSGMVNFCSGTDCVGTVGDGTNFAKCG